MDYKKRKRLAGFVALGGIALALIIIFAAQKAGSQTGGMIGAGVFIAACIATAVIDTKNSSKSKNGVRIANGGKYDPLLLDERTKQFPEVQRLLQYTSVQKAFFDPNYLATAEAQNDPNVRELLAVFDEMLLSRAANGDSVPYPSQSASGATPYSKELLQDDLKLQKKAKRKPRHTVGAVLAYIGVATLIIPFILVFLVLFANPEDGAVQMSSVLFTAAPIGFVLIIVGSIIGRR